MSITSEIVPTVGVSVDKDCSVRGHGHCKLEEKREK